MTEEKEQYLINNKEALVQKNNANSVSIFHNGFWQELTIDGVNNAIYLTNEWLKKLQQAKAMLKDKKYCFNNDTMSCANYDNYDID